MILRDDADFASFMKAVQQCRGEVYYDSVDGDHLNLKSALSQFVFAVASGNGFGALTGEILCDPEDEPLLRPFTCEVAS